MMWARRAIVLVAVAVHAIVLAAPWLAPYDPAAQRRLLAFAPPSRPHAIDPQGRWHLRPFVCAIEPSADAPFRYTEDCSRMYFLRSFVSRTETVGFTTRKTLHVFGVDEPGELFLFGTDEFGRDVFSRVLIGARISLLMAISAASLSLALGVLFGSLAGYLGGAVDAMVSGATELVLALPWLYLLLAVRAAMPLSLTPTEAFVIIMILLGAIGWARPARLVRAVVASARTNDYVVAARTAGASTPHVLRRHLLPQLPVVLVPLALQLVPQFILGETTLSLFGLGVPEPAPSWGTLLASAQRPQVLVDTWWLLAPVAGLIGICVMYYTLARTLRSGTLISRL
jgi:peptide/nickel transport system permease protein